MANDRQLSLLNQAFIEGFLDPKEARIGDRIWDLKSGWTLDWIENRNRNKIRELKHEMNAALLSYQSSKEAVDMHWDQAKVLQGNIKKTLIPWEQLDSSLAVDEIKSMKDQWTSIWGDPKDPKVAAEIERTVNYLYNKIEQ